MRQRTSFENRIVVGFDGSRHAEIALDWAAEGASRRGLGMSVVVASESPARAVYEGGWVEPTEEFLADAAREISTSGCDRVSERFPDLDVDGVVVRVSPAQALIDASETAVAVTLGTRGRGEWTGLLLGSVSAAVVAHATGTVIVIPAGGSQAPDGPIVMGYDVSDDARRAMRFAFAFAAAEPGGAKITVVRAWGAMRNWRLSPQEHAELADQVRSENQQLVDDAIRTAAVGHEGVQVSSRLVHGSPAQALIDASTDARLVVVGSRGRGAFRGMLLGSTSRAVLHSAHAPVAVVHAARAG